MSPLLAQSGHPTVARQCPPLGVKETCVLRNWPGFVCTRNGAAFDPEALARLEAERARKEDLKSQPNVVLLEDWRQNS
jgi:hypothetical protein